MDRDLNDLLPILSATPAKISSNIFLSGPRLGPQLALNWPILSATPVKISSNILLSGPSSICLFYPQPLPKFLAIFCSPGSILVFNWPILSATPAEISSLIPYYLSLQRMTTCPSTGGHCLPRGKADVQMCHFSATTPIVCFYSFWPCDMKAALDLKR